MSDNYEIMEATTQQAQVQQAPFFDLAASNINQGTVMTEVAKAIADSNNRVRIAKAYPRDENKALSKMLDVCSRKEFAQKAFYSFPRGGSTVSGLSIYAVQELARLWGNLDWGFKELSEGDGKSEMQAYCWDMETNTITVQNYINRHALDVKGGIKELTSLRDIYDNNANMNSRRVRSRILAMLPDYVHEAVIAACKQTLRGSSKEPLIDRVNKMVGKFKDLGVTIEMLENRLKKPVSQMTPDDFDEYIGIYNSIHEKYQTAGYWFGGSSDEYKSDLGNTLDELEALDKGSEVK